MKRLGVLVAAVLLIALVPSANAATQGSCSPTDPTKVLLWENPIGQTQSNNDNLWLCQTETDLNTRNHTLPGNCVPNDPLSDHWNDCVDSVSVYLSSSHQACFWSNANGGGTLLLRINGPRYGTRFNISQGQSSLSSVEIVLLTCTGG